MSHLDKLVPQVRDTVTTIQSAIVFMNGLAEKLKEFKNDPAEIQALADTLRDSSTQLAEAIVTNTPQE